MRLPRYTVSCGHCGQVLVDTHRRTQKHVRYCDDCLKAITAAKRANRALGRIMAKLSKG